MIHREATLSVPITGSDAATLYYQTWRPEEQPRAAIIIVHGVAEHSGRYERLAGYLVDRGYAVIALDHPGHGRSTGDPGHIDRFSDYLKCLDSVHTKVADEMSGVPQILLGHSMGGLIGTLYLLQNQDAFVGCILSGPAIKTDIEPGKFQMALIRALSRVFPKAGVLQLDASGVSRDANEVDRYVNDPLVYAGKLSARLVLELFNSMAQIQSRAAKITLPILILHGGADAMASPEGSKFLAEQVSSKNKRLEIYPGLYHEIFNEPEHDQIFEDISKWCNELLGFNR